MDDAGTHDEQAVLEHPPVPWYQPPADLDWTRLSQGLVLAAPPIIKRFGPSRLELVPNELATLLGWLTGFFAFGMLIRALVLIGAGHLDGGVWLVIDLVAWLAIAVLTRRLLRGQHVFDGRRGLYWNTSRGGGRIIPQPDALPLAQIRAIQIIAAPPLPGALAQRGFHELNLVLHDGRRLNVIDLGESARVRRDAEQLAAWLGVPIWILD